MIIKHGSSDLRSDGPNRSLFFSSSSPLYRSNLSFHQKTHIKPRSTILAQNFLETNKEQNQKKKLLPFFGSVKIWRWCLWNTSTFIALLRFQNWWCWNSLKRSRLITVVTGPKLLVVVGKFEFLVKWRVWIRVWRFWIDLENGLNTHVFFMFLFFVIFLCFDLNDSRKKKD